MENPKKRILFFTPYATRTGSEMMLLYIIQNIDRSRFDVGVVSFANGELLTDLPSDVPVFIAPKNYNLIQKVKYRFGINPTSQYLKKIAEAFNADYWYVNTMMLPEAVEISSAFSVKLITHIHELPLTYGVLGTNDIQNIIAYSDLVIGCSKVTCQALEAIGGKNVALLYSFIDSAKVTTDQARTKALRLALNIPENDYIWVLSGVTSERKGFDLLPDIAEELNDHQVHLIWIGDKLNNGLVYYTEQRCLNSKSKTRIHLIGKQKEDYYNYLNAGDGFLLTSRQDPFPLVMIEAALLGKPIVSFPSGGVSEFIEEGMGTITDDLSVRQMVIAMRNVMNGHTYTAPAKSRTRAGVFNVKHGYENWINIIDKMH